MGVNIVLTSSSSVTCHDDGEVKMHTADNLCQCKQCIVYTDLQELLELLCVVLDISDYLDGHFLPTVSSFIQVSKSSSCNLALESNFTRLQFPVIYGRRWSGQFWLWLQSTEDDGGHVIDKMNRSQFCALAIACRLTCCHPDWCWHSTVLIMSLSS